MFFTKVYCSSATPPPGPVLPYTWIYHDSTAPSPTNFQKLRPNDLAVPRYSNLRFHMTRLVVTENGCPAIEGSVRRHANNDFDDIFASEVALMPMELQGGTMVLDFKEFQNKADTSEAKPEQLFGLELGPICEDDFPRLNICFMKGDICYGDPGQIMVDFKPVVPQWVILGDPRDLFKIFCK